MIGQLLCAVGLHRDRLDSIGGSLATLTFYSRCSRCKRVSL